MPSKKKKNPQLKKIFVGHILLTLTSLQNAHVLLLVMIQFRNFLITFREKRYVLHTWYTNTSSFPNLCMKGMMQLPERGLRIDWNVRGQTRWWQQLMFTECLLAICPLMSLRSLSHVILKRVSLNLYEEDRIIICISQTGKPQHSYGRREVIDLAKSQDWWVLEPLEPYSHPWNWLWSQAWTHYYAAFWITYSHHCKITLFST